VSRSGAQPNDAEGDGSAAAAAPVRRGLAFPPAAADNHRVRRLCVSLALLVAAAGLSGCAVDGAIMGRPAGPDAAKLLADSRSALGSQESIRIVSRERTRSGRRSTTITSLQFHGIDLVIRQRGGIEADLRVLDGSAWSRGNPLYWVSSQGLEASQVPLVRRGWAAMRPADLHLPPGSSTRSATRPCSSAAASPRSPATGCRSPATRPSTATPRRCSPTEFPIAPRASGSWSPPPRPICPSRCPCPAGCPRTRRAA
jgi:hypothetical protein